MADILEGLAIVGAMIASELMSAVSSANVPSAIKDNISVEPPKQEGGIYSIDIVINHPAALAFEYGSGIHATKGEVGKYEITPKNASVLAFEWQPEFIPWSSPKFAGLGEGGKFLFHRVEHPGVAPRPFIAPTIRENMPEVMKRLGTFVKAEILSGQKRIEVIDAKG